ncbi:hypothetical protein PPERSA_02332 [Pseudocohnilembus persalinus]|uniref:Uncharacterized protein n=1 Tax=Pseudocohnilembus persalinus TaxID=266149 RepID=A0A0V0QV22_PSEPJ|nr:hypothetical protein PPERSA_02332 [Pseudocohnilembus persalinus]|eukprot:KRX05800.1 hypothetical protein PPERSA_02332 [Pseudocohnilembus persalinus]
MDFNSNPNLNSNDLDYKKQKKTDDKLQNGILDHINNKSKQNSSQQATKNLQKQLQNGVQQQNTKQQTSEIKKNPKHNQVNQEINIVQNQKYQLDKQDFDTVIVGGGCSSLALLVNAYRSDRLESLIKNKGLCIIEQTDRFGGGSLEENLIPSNTPAIGIIKYIMKNPEANMLIGDFLGHIQYDENTKKFNPQKQKWLSI